MAKQINAALFVINVLAAFNDKENPGKEFKPGDSLTTDDIARVNNIVRLGLGAIKTVEVAANEDGKDKGDKKPAVVSVLGTEYDLAKVKEALKAIGVSVAANAGPDNVAKKIAELTDEQATNLSAKLSESETE